MLLLLRGAATVVAMAHLLELLHFLLPERLLVSKKMGDQGDLREVLYGFHLHVGALERRSECDDPVIGHQDGIVVGNQGLESVCQLGSSWRAVAGKRYRAQSDHDLTDKRAIQIVSGCREACGSRRMCMHDAVHI